MTRRYTLLKFTKFSPGSPGSGCHYCILFCVNFCNIYKFKPFLDVSEGFLEKFMYELHN